MSQFHLKFLLNCLSDEANLAQALPTLIPSLLNTSNAGNDEASLAKLHARISTLIQSRDVGVRWCGVCLAKAVLERPDGRWESLMSHGSTWMKLLLKVLERETSEPVLKRTVSTIDAMIRMTEGKPSLTRDLTTPSLPTFFTHVFSILSKPFISDNLRKNILHHVQKNLTSHSTTFRPFAGKLHIVALNIISGSCSDPQLIELAARCFASLHMCAPKNTAAEQWNTGMSAAIGECHASLSYIFQTVVEDKPTLPIPKGLDMLMFNTDYSSQVPLAIRRLSALMETVRAFLSLPTKEAVKIPVGQLVMLIQRMLEVTPKSGIKASTPQASQVALISVLPQLHAMSFDLTLTCIDILGNHMAQHVHTLQELILADCVISHHACKVSALNALSASIRQFSFVGENVQAIGSVVRNCVATLESIVPSITSTVVKHPATNGSAQGHKKRKHGGVNEGSDQISHSSAFHQCPADDLVSAACDLLSAVLSNTFGLLTKGTRQILDLTVLRLLNHGASGIDTRTTTRLLHLVECSLTGPEPSVSAAAVLTAGLNTVSAFCGSADPQIRLTAICVRDRLEVLIHPRFPATRRRAPLVEEDLLQEEDEQSEQAEGSNQDKVEMIDDDKIEADGAPELPSEPRKPAFEIPDKYPSIPHPTSRPPVDGQEESFSDSETKKPRLDTAESRTQTSGGALFGVTLSTPDVDEQQVEETGDRGDSDDDEDGSIPEICMDSDTDLEGE